MGIAKFDAKKAAKVQEPINTERKLFTDGIGTLVQSATSLETAIKLSGLDFEVVKQPAAYIRQVPQKMSDGTTIMVECPVKVPNRYYTVRTDTWEGLGEVSEGYQILQNREAFDFLDGMLAEAKFETAGDFGGGGAKSFITMSTEPMKILGDNFQPYILLTNSHDGTGSVRVCFTPVRVFCSNTLVRAWKNGENKLSIRHSTNLQYRLAAAREVLLKNSEYLEALKKEAEKLAVTPFSAEAFEALARSLFPVNEADKEVSKIRNEMQLEALLRAYRQDDLGNFAGTAWRAVQAVADFESHEPVFRRTETAKFHNITNVMNGMPMTNMITDRLLATA